MLDCTSVGSFSFIHVRIRKLEFELCPLGDSFLFSVFHNCNLGVKSIKRSEQDSCLPGIERSKDSVKGFSFLLI